MHIPGNEQFDTKKKSKDHYLAQKEWEDLLGGEEVTGDDPGELVEDDLHDASSEDGVKPCIPEEYTGEPYPVLDRDEHSEAEGKASVGEGDVAGDLDLEEEEADSPWKWIAIAFAVIVAIAIVAICVFSGIEIVQNAFESFARGLETLLTGNYLLK